MKKTLLYTICFLVTGICVAQIDRSQQPKPGPAPEINLKEPNTFKLDNGLKVMVVENHKLPRVSIQLSIDNPPILEGKKAGVSSLTGSLLGKGSKSISKEDFNEEVDFLGASINFNSQSAYASSLSKYFPRILKMMADAAIHPNFIQEEFEAEKAKLLTNIKNQENDVSAVATRVQLALTYGKDHPYGEITSEETVNNINLDDVKEFYSDYFVPANAYLIIIGDVEFEKTKKLVTEAFTPWTKAAPPSLSYSEPTDTQYTQINFVDMPNAVQSEVSVQNVVELKMKDEDYLSALIANQILGGGFNSRLFLNLREDKGYTYGSYSSIRNNKYVPVRFNAFAQVRNQVTDSSVVQILREIDSIIKVPVTEEELKNTKAKYIGQFVRALENPQTIANYAYNIETEDLSEDFYTTYLERINDISIEDVHNAAKKYFTTDKARIVVVGKGSEVLENLKKITFDGKAVPIQYFDKNAVPVDKPNYNAKLPEGIGVNDVLNKYLEAIGGKEKLEGVESYVMLAEAEMQGMKLNLEMKKTINDQFMQDLKVGGNSMSKQVLNGDSGYVIMQGQKKEFNEEELEKVKKESVPFPELEYLNSDVTLEGMDIVDGKQAYKVKVTDEKSIFYDMETGLKLQEINVAEMGGQEVTSTVNFTDYREVSGILFPFQMAQTVGPQSFEFIVSEVKVNEDVSDADFD
ncbi:MAG: insulinase family protein [Pricia sp.]|nr:insulinase family protein [Pricia sp.]